LVRRRVYAGRLTPPPAAVSYQARPSAGYVWIQATMCCGPRYIWRGDIMPGHRMRELFGYARATTDAVTTPVIGAGGNQIAALGRSKLSRQTSVTAGGAALAALPLDGAGSAFFPPQHG